MKVVGYFRYKFVAVTCLWLVSICSAITSTTIKQKSADDFMKGKVKDTVVSSKGTIQLGRAAKVLVEEFEDVWSINSIVIAGDAVYVGTSPNGGVYKYSMGNLTEVYSSRIAQDSNQPKTEPNQSQQGEPNKVQQQQHFSNEHIFAMSMDISGCLLVGVSGQKCRLMRLEKGQMQEVIALNEDKYIFAIVLDDSGNIYLGTGPEGRIYRLDSFGKNKEVAYDSLDKNILSLAAGKDGILYAGSDSRGLVYKIDLKTKSAAVLYDSAQDEITGLTVTQDGNLYAAATSAKVLQSQEKFAVQQHLAGKPEIKIEPKKENQGGVTLRVANTKESSKEQQGPQKPPVVQEAKPGTASYVYRISKDGYVTRVFSEAAVFFNLTRQGGQLLVGGSGNTARLFAVDPVDEQEKVIYEDEKASQITAVAAVDDEVYVGTANPAKLVKLGGKYAAEGTFSSGLLEASQPADWGMIQIEADIPEGCGIKVASRSGGVQDINDPTFSQWTEPVEVAGPVALTCPVGRFCQYKLILQTLNDSVTPTIREVAASYAIPNVAPRVDEVTVNRIENKPGKEGYFTISYKAKDDNQDQLIYKIDFRKIGWTKWINLEDKIEADNFEWNGRTVEDGRYEIKVTVSDERSNTTQTKLEASRISDTVVVDNTGPAIEKITQKSVEDGDKLQVSFELKVTDELSAVAKLEYTVDSNKDWIATVPDDMVYDTTEESFNVVIKNLAKGEHIISFKAADAVSNVTYRTFEISDSNP